METLNKSNLADRVTYEIAGSPIPGYSVTLYKEAVFHLEIIADFPISDATTWEEYVTQIEAGNTVAI